MSQDNTCPCPNPPGGSISCRPDQLAFCAMENGKIRSGCVDMPKEIAMALNSIYDLQEIPSPDFLCWVFGAVTKKPIDVNTLEIELKKLGVKNLNDPKILLLLETGKMTLFGSNVHFRLPQKAQAEVGISAVA